MRVTFVSDRRDSHAYRFSRSLRASFPDFKHVQIDTIRKRPHARVSESQHRGWAAISRSLDVDGTVVLSGPLDSVSSHLELNQTPHIGISWATDAMVFAGASEVNLQAWRRTISKLSAVVTDNLATENALIACGMKSEDIIRFSWGPVRAASTSAEGYSEWNLPKSGRLVLFARSIDPHYEPLLFVEAISDLCNQTEGTTWCLIEQGRDIYKAKEQIEARGLDEQVLWLPPTSERHLQQMLPSFFCIVSAAVTDGTSVTIREAMDAGVPVVTSLTNGAAEWVVNGITGWTFPVGSRAGLCAALRNCLNASDNHLRQIRQNAMLLSEMRGGWDEGFGRLKAEIQERSIS